MWNYRCARCIKTFGLEIDKIHKCDFQNVLSPNNTVICMLSAFRAANEN